MAEFVNEQNFAVRNTGGPEWSTDIQWDKMPVSYQYYCQFTLTEVLVSVFKWA